MRMHMRRFTRLTNAFSKKVENHACAVALHSMYYNFVRIHQTLKVSPAMAAGVTDRLWEMGDVVDMLEAWESKEKRDDKSIFEICEDTISRGAYVRATLTDGIVDRVYGFANEGEAAWWSSNESTVWLHERHKAANCSALIMGESPQQTACPWPKTGVRLRSPDVEANRARRSSEQFYTDCCCHWVPVPS
jgi:hypothetical protein